MAVIPVKVGDIHFDFENSCNCCLKRKVKDNTHVYINADGVAVKFTAQEEKDVSNALRETIQRLESKIEILSAHHDKDHAMVLSQVEARTNSTINPDAEEHEPMTWGLLNAITAAVEEIFGG